MFRKIARLFALPLFGVKKSSTFRFQGCSLTFSTIDTLLTIVSFFSHSGAPPRSEQFRHVYRLNLQLNNQRDLANDQQIIRCRQTTVIDRSVNISCRVVPLIDRCSSNCNRRNTRILDESNREGEITRAEIVDKSMRASIRPPSLTNRGHLNEENSDESPRERPPFPTDKSARSANESIG